ncbi:MAG: hypothetical protein RPU41_03220 [Candidatus Sedimenticola sp. (ex Thyasira tokunagai)]
MTKLNDLAEEVIATRDLRDTFSKNGDSVGVRIMKRDLTRLLFRYGLRLQKVTPRGYWRSELLQHASATVSGLR